jgi:hypothetical protein
VHDFDVLLRFIGTNGIETAGEWRLPPIKMLPDLNAAMREPLRVDLQRGQLKSYPNLAALLMLARATGLVMVQANGDETRLAVDEELLRQWLELNPVERYCTLLDAWAMHASSEVIGERDRRGELLVRGIESWRRIPKNGRKYSNEQRGSAELYKDIDYRRYNLAFLWLFGLVEVEQGAPLPKKTWCPAAIRHTQFGDALLTLLAHADLHTGQNDIFSAIFDFADDADEEENDQRESGEDQAEDEGEDEEDQPGKAVALDELQPILRPYFPQWERALTIPPPEFRDGVHIFKVALKGWKVWRRFAVPEEVLWDDFGDAIRRSVNFDDDHLWAFTWTDRFGDEVQITRGEADDLGFTPSMSGAEYQVGAGRRCGSASRSPSSTTSATAGRSKSSSNASTRPTRSSNAPSFSKSTASRRSSTRIGTSRKQPPPVTRVFNPC